MSEEKRGYRSDAAGQEVMRRKIAGGSDAYAYAPAGDKIASKATPGQSPFGEASSDFVGQKNHYLLAKRR